MKVRFKNYFFLLTTYLFVLFIVRDQINLYENIWTGSLLYLFSFVVIFFLPGFFITNLLKINNDNHVIKITISFLFTLSIYFIFFLIFNFLSLPFLRIWILLISAIVSFSCLLFSKNNIFCKIKKIDKLKLFWGTILVFIIFYLFRGKFIWEVFSGDGSEHLEKALSMQQFILPHKETGHDSSLWGVPIYTPDIFYSFFNFIIAKFWGVLEGFFRLPYLVFIFLAYYLTIEIVDLCRHSLLSKNRKVVYPVISCFFFLYTLSQFIYTSSGYYFVDIIDPLKNILFILFIMLQIYFLIKERLGLFILSAVCSSLMLYTGPLFTFMLVVLYFIFSDKKKRIFFKKAFFGYFFSLFILILLFLSYGIWYGQLGIWGNIFYQRYLQSRILSTNSALELFVFIKYFIVIVGIAPVLIFWFLPKDNKIKPIALSAIIYFLLILFCGHKNIHYFAPSIILFMLVYLIHDDFKPGILKNFKKKMILFLFCMVLSFILIKPLQYKVFTQAREFGNKTAILLKDYWQIYSFEAFQQAESIDKIYSKLKLENPILLGKNMQKRR